MQFGQRVRVRDRLCDGEFEKGGGRGANSRGMGRELFRAASLPHRRVRS